MGTATLTAPEQGTDTFPINGTDFIEFYVGNAKQAAHFYRNVFGYKILAYRGPETGTRDRASYILEQGKVRLVLTTALRPDSEIATHVHKHGDGVKDIALWVDDARKAFRLAELCAPNGFPKPPAISEADLARVRQKRAEVFEQWDAVEPGSALELTFDVDASEPALSRAQTEPRRAKSQKS
jgi:4-hydroxyphenylpyruvate dioxygenase-like putative hemolysin